jgi:hypothetical protein
MVYVEILRNELNSPGVDYDALAKIIASTIYQERVVIRRIYIQIYNEDLVYRLKIELSDDFKEAVIGSFMNPTEYDAYCLNCAMKRIDPKEKKENVLTEIIGSRTPQELNAIKKGYKEKYDDVLDNIVASETSGEYQKLLLSLLKCQRINDQTYDDNGCSDDASALYKIGKGKWGTDEALFSRVFAIRSPVELVIINKYYKQYAGKGLLSAINNEFSGDTKNYYLL